MKSVSALSMVVWTLFLGSTFDWQQGSRPASPPSTTSEHLPASPTVLITVVGESLGDLRTPQKMILWRGAPKWYLSQPQSTSGGGSAESFQLHGSYGDVEVSFQVFSRPLRMTINGVDVANASANVFLVDGVDRKGTAPDVQGINVSLKPGSALDAALAGAAIPAIREFIECPALSSPAWLVCSRMGGT